MTRERISREQTVQKSPEPKSNGGEFSNKIGKSLPMLLQAKKLNSLFGENRRQEIQKMERESNSTSDSGIQLTPTGSEKDQDSDDSPPGTPRVGTTTRAFNQAIADFDMDEQGADDLRQIQIRWPAAERDRFYQQSQVELRADMNSFYQTVQESNLNTKHYYGQDYSRELADIRIHVSQIRRIDDDVKWAMLVSDVDTLAAIEYTKTSNWADEVDALFGEISIRR